MSQKLSFNSIAATLAVLSASGLVACGGAATPPAESAADAKEVPAATAAEVDAAAVDQGPMKGGVTPSEGASGSTPTPATAPAPDAPKADAPAATAAPATKAAPAKKKTSGAKAGCGAGTCG